MIVWITNFNIGQFHHWRILFLYTQYVQVQLYTATLSESWFLNGRLMYKINEYKLYDF